MATAVNVLNQATKKRKDVLKPLMMFCLGILNEPSHQVNPRKKDGVLHIVGSIADVLMEVRPIVSIYLIIVTHIVPLLGYYNFIIRGPQGFCLDIKCLADSLDLLNARGHVLKQIW